MNKKEPYGFSVCGFSNAYMQSPIWATDRFFCLKLPKGPFYMSVNSKGCGKTVLMHGLA